MKTVEEKINDIYKQLPEAFKTAFVSAMLFGLIAHVYMFTNKLPNFDDLVGLDGFGVTFKNGRWFLWVIGAIAYHLDWVFSLPWINGLITLLTIAVSAGIIAHLLGCRSRVLNTVIGAILVVFPSWTGTFFYMFTAPYYGIAVLLAIISVYLTVKTRFGFIAGIILLACSMGIYQSYFPFTATLYVVLLIVMLFDDEYTYLDILKKSFYYLFNLISGIVVYFICMKLSLAITGQILNDYKGLSNMGQFDFSRIGEIVQTIWRNFFCIFMNNNMEISYNLVTKIMYFVLICGSVLMLGNLLIKQIKQRDYLKVIETVVLSVAYVIAVNSIYIMCSDGIYSLMYYSYSFDNFSACFA